MHKQVNDDSFYEVSCYIATSFEECADYIRTIHTTDTGALPWTDVAKKRFENKLGIKNMFSQLKEYCSKPFENVSDNFSVNKFEKIVTSKVGKEYLKIDNTDNILTHESTIEELEYKLAKIVKDIDTGVLKNENIKNSTEMKKYLYEENKETVLIHKDDIIFPSKENSPEAENEEINRSTDEMKNENVNNELLKDTKNEQLSIIMPNSYEVIKVGFIIVAVQAEIMANVE